MQLVRTLRRIPGRRPVRHAYPDATWYRRSGDAWLTRDLPATLGGAGGGAQTAEIERLAARANDLSPQLLWRGYPPQTRGPARQADEVRTARYGRALHTRRRATPPRGGRRVRRRPADRP